MPLTHAIAAEVGLLAILIAWAPAVGAEAEGPRADEVAWGFSAAAGRWWAEGATPGGVEPLQVARSGQGPRSSEAWLARDKALHLGLSFLATLGGGAWLRSAGMAEEDCPVWAAGTVVSLGVFKEMAFDRQRVRGRASWRDVVADLAGVAGAWLVWRLATES